MGKLLAFLLQGWRLNFPFSFLYGNTSDFSAAGLAPQLLLFFFV